MCGQQSELLNIFSGTCRNGVCKPFCEALNLKPCKCSGVDDSCKVCCQGSNGICAPHRDNNTGSTLDILDGRSCQGEGQQGTCVKVTHLLEYSLQCSRLIIANVTSSRSFIPPAMFDLKWGWTVGVGGGVRARRLFTPPPLALSLFWPSTAP